MDRLQKKCFIASAGFHLLLALILLIGPAFLASKSTPENLPLLDFVPVRTVDSLLSGGGDPKATPPLAQPDAPPVVPVPGPVAPTPQPQPEKTEKPEPVKDPAKEAVKVKDAAKEDPAPETDPDSLVPTTKPKPRRPEISTTAVLRKPDSKADAKARAAAEEREAAQEAAAIKGRFASAIAGTASSIGSKVSGGTSITLPGIGGGGVPYANFLQGVKKVYDNAWLLPDGAADSDATVVASVTIARNGKVISARIIRFSGNTEVNRSVQAALDRVKYAVSLPEEAKEDQRTVKINFDVNAKKALG